MLLLSYLSSQPRRIFNVTVAVVLARHLLSTKYLFLFLYRFFQLVQIPSNL
ncbi:hypothetical protein A2U01_0074405, partial [Trifolium medium]|nr:hypothetical protein [Trifolium medium]